MNRTDDVLRSELLGLARTLRADDIPLIVGGGYGLLLRQEYLHRSGTQTVREMPYARSTNDIDIFLSAEIITDARKMSVLRDALRDSGYSPIQGAEYYQFKKAVSYRGGNSEIKVDLLAPQPRDPELLEKVHVDARRIRPRASQGIHAHTTPEAFSIAEEALCLTLSDNAIQVDVFIPHPYSFMLLKLFAYHDRKDDQQKNLGRHHAFDLYRIIAMMDETDYNAAARFRDRLDGDAVVEGARRIVSELFSGSDSSGMRAIREYSSTVGTPIGANDLTAFLEDLTTFFPKPGI